MRLAVEVVPIHVRITYGHKSFFVDEKLMHRLLEKDEPCSLKDWWFNYDVPEPDDDDLFWSQLRAACFLALEEIEFNRAMHWLKT